jgi:hypothetical protein
MAHTPGPWEAYETPGRWNVHQKTAQSDGWTFAEIRRLHVTPEATTTAKDNARLIAAAPELLAALEKCAAVIGDLSVVQNDGLTRNEGIALEDAYAAIAKAKGLPT